MKSLIYIFLGCDLNFFLQIITFHKTRRNIFIMNQSSKKKLVNIFVTFNIGSILACHKRVIVQMLFDIMQAFIVYFNIGMCLI